MAADLEAPAAATARLVERLRPVGVEQVDLDDAAGRVLAEEILSDRPSPSSDVSAMDGYAVRIADALPGRLPVSGEASIGQRPPSLPEGTAMLVFTGAPIPDGAEGVIKREDVAEEAEAITIPEGLEATAGLHVRYAGENLAAGVGVVEPGVQINTSIASALATFGRTRPSVFENVRVGVIVTGDEVLSPDEDPTPWQLRDSNGSALASLVGTLPWASLEELERAVDRPELLHKSLDDALATCHAVFLTGGVSMGDYDYVPGAVVESGGEVIFHKLRQRPGKPVLGAVGAEGQAILGLPGNPVSVMVTARRLGVAALRRLAGLQSADPPPPQVELVEPDDATLDLWWHRLVRLVAPGKAELVPSMGSGDLVSAARSDGFVVVPPGQSGPGPWPYYSWTP